MKNKISILNTALTLICFFIILGWSFIPYPRYLKESIGTGMMVNSHYILMYNITSFIISISLMSIIIPQIGNKKWMKILTMIISITVLLINAFYLILSLISQKIFINTSQKLWMINVFIVNTVLGFFIVKTAIKWWKETDFTTE